MARLLVNPCSKVFFAGWESDTYKLGNQGWDVSIQENFEFGRFDAMFHHKGANLILHAIANDQPMREHTNRIAGMPRFDGPMFNVVRAFANDPNLKVYHEMPVFSIWSETKPAMVDIDSAAYNPFDFPIFMKKGDPPPAQELIVEPQDVMQLLEQIKRMQAPEQATIRERRRRDTPMAHATILSFGDAA